MISKVALDKLKETYLDCFIVCHLRDMQVIIFNEEQESAQISASVSGLCVEIDDYGFYIADESGYGIKTVRHDSAGVVEILVPEEFAMMEEMPTEQDDVH